MAAICLTGCLTVERAKTPGDDGATHVFVRNYGKYLFNCVPMGCGNVNENPKCDFVMFRDDVTMDKMTARFMSECRKCGGEPSEVSYHTEEDMFLRIPMFSIVLPIPYLWTHHEIQISGVVK